MKKISPPQYKVIAELLKMQCITGVELKELILFITQKRTQKIVDIYYQEAISLQDYLIKNDRTKEKVTTVLNLAFSIGLIYGHTKIDMKINIAKLNMFLLKEGKVKKDVFLMNYYELIKTISQLTGILNAIEEMECIRQTDSLLKELNIKSQFRKKQTSITKKISYDHN